MSSSPPSRWVDPLGPRTDRQEPYLPIFKCNVYVADQDRSLRFYVDKLGFHVVYDVEFEAGQRWLAVAPPDGSTVICFIHSETRCAGRKVHRPAQRDCFRNG